MLDEIGRWRMGMLVPGSDTDFLEWLEGYVASPSEARLAAVDGAVCLSGVTFESIQANQPLRAWIGGGFWDNDGQGYPLFRPLELALTPIAPCDRVEVELFARDARAQAYLVQLVTAIGDRWPEAGPTLWMHRPKTQIHRLVELKLKTDLPNFALGLEEFAGFYHTEAVMVVSVCEQPASVGQINPPSRKRQRAWTVHVHLPGSGRPYRCIREFDLTLTASRISGKCPVMVTLARQGYLFPEVTANARNFQAWCQENWRTAPVRHAPIQSEPPARRSAMPADSSWDLIPDHL